jgi:hypothetical protein
MICPDNGTSIKSAPWRHGMLDWCRANITAGEWDQHGRSEKALGQVPADFARFYFMTGADADLFRWRWLKQ